MYAKINISQRKIEGTTDRISVVKVASHSGGMGEIKISFTGRDFGHGGSGGGSGTGGDYHPKGGDEKLDFKARVLMAFSGMINRIESLLIKSEKIEADSANIEEIEAAIMHSPGYRQGLLSGKGWQVWIDNNGDTHFEVDFVDIRKGLRATKLSISEVEVEGGIRMQGAAIMQISKIVDLTNLPSSEPEYRANAIRLYFDNKDGKISNQFRIGDQARCHRINLEGSLDVAYSWRVVCGKGEDYIEVYKDNVNTFEKEDLDDVGVMLTVNREVDSGSGMPKENDVVVACGNIADTNRMAYIIEQTIGENAPIREEWSFVNDFRPSVAANRSYHSDANYTEQCGDRHVWRTRKGVKPLLFPPEPWVDGTVANYPESYTYDGATYVCMSQDVTETPNKSSDKWMLTASKGSKGDYQVTAFRWAAEKPAKPVGSDPEGWSSRSDRTAILADESGNLLTDDTGAVLLAPYPENYQLWSSVATFSGATDEIVGEWSEPYQATGTPGETPMVYELLPSIPVVKKDTAGVLSPSTVNCRVVLRRGNQREVLGVDDKIEFEGRDTLSPAPEDYVIKLDGAAYTPGTAVTPTDNLNWTLHDPLNDKEIDRKSTIFSEDIEFGGVNLALDSKKGWRSTAYNVLRENLSQDWVVGQTYTITVKGTINTPNKFGLWRDDASIMCGILTPIGAGVHSLTFVCPAPYAGQSLNRFSLYNYPGNTATLATIEWVKIERGNRSTDWSPAPEDVQGNIDKIAAGFGFNTQAELMAYLGDLSDPNGNKIFEVDMTSGKLTLNTLIAGKIAVDELFVKNITAPDGLFLEKLAVAEFTAENATFRKFNTRINNNGTGCVMTPDGKFALMGYNSINENTVQLVVDGVGKRPELYLSSYSNNRSARMLLDKIQFANLYGAGANAEFGLSGAILPYDAKVDMPGVQLAGRVDGRLPSITSAWSSRVYGCERYNGQEGQYEIWHYLHHTDYYVTANLADNGGYMGGVIVINRQQDFVVLGTYGMDARYTNLNFDFMICGKGQKPA